MIQVWGELHKVDERKGRRNWRGRELTRRVHD
jgi:hypothetical protein